MFIKMSNGNIKCTKRSRLEVHLMKKRYIISLMSIIGLIAVRLKRNKDKASRKDNFFELTIEKAGIPDQMDIETITQLENSKMVSEGSQFGVQYFNEAVEENARQESK